MRTKVMQDKIYRYDILLTVSGWALAIFVSFLYLNDTSRPIVVHEPAEQTERKAPVPVIETRTDKVDSLLLESRILLSRDKPIETINRITTLWSVCHSTQQEVPEESHLLFAQAVSLLSRNRDDGLRPRSEQRKETGAALPSSSAKREDETQNIKPGRPSDAIKEPQLTIPTPNYPRAKGELKSYPLRHPKVKNKSDLPPPPVASDGERRPPAFPPPPRPDSDSRLPVPPPQPGGGRPPGPPPRSSAGSHPPRPPSPGVPGRGERRGPLDADTGGPPPGYYY
jgi:hypothetical protein